MNISIRRALIWVAVSTKAQVHDDKVSLKKQESDAREVCERNGWTVVDVLKVPGHSRDYIDIHECAADMRKRGIDAFDKLIRHWEDKDFDVLIVRDGDRVARTQTLHSHVVERTILELNKTIYVLNDNTLYTRENFRLWNTFSGWKAAEDNQDRVRKRTATLDHYIERGLPYTNGRVLWTHKVVRDPNTGKIASVVMRDEYRSVINAMAKLIIEGTAYDNVGGKLHELYGYTDTNGKPYTYRKIYRTIMNPCFWGHTARNFRKNARMDVTDETSGLWMLDEGEPVPEWARVAYNTHEPALSGELSERLKAEIRRRVRVIMGKTRPQFSYAFTGLLVCGECGYMMVKSSRKQPHRVTHYMRCNTPHVTRGVTCTNRTHINDKKIRAYFQLLIERILSGDTSLDDVEYEKPNVTGIENEVLKLDSQIGRLIVLQEQADDSLAQDYLTRVNQLAQQRTAALKRLAETREQIKQLESVNEERGRAIDEVRSFGDAFWQQSDYRINQTMHRIFAGYRFTVLDGEITGYFRQIRVV